MYQIIISQKAEKQIEKLEKLTQERIFSVLDRIKIRPFHFVKRKQGTPYFILRIGEYRAILNIKSNVLLIFVLKIGARGDIYKR